MSHKAGYGLLGQDAEGDAQEAGRGQRARARARAVRAALGAVFAGVGVGCLALALAPSCARRALAPIGDIVAAFERQAKDGREPSPPKWIGDGVGVFERNGTSDFVVAKDVCVRRRFDDCHEFTRNHFGAKVSLSHTFKHWLDIRPATPSDAPSKIKGSTVLFTVAHCGEFFRWSNIAHFARELIPLANFIDEHGRELAQNALVWEAARPQLVGSREVGGVLSDWYLETLASELLHGEQRHQSMAKRIYACEQVPLASRGGRSLCFERLVAFPGPPSCPPPTFSRPSVCGGFRSRVYQRLGLRPAAQPDAQRVLVLVRTDGQGWSNHDQAAADIASYVEGAGGSADTVFLNHSHMTLREQVRWVMNAGVVVTTHGAHEMNLMFAREGSFHIEYFKRDHGTIAFSDVAASCGLHYVAAHSKDTRFAKFHGTSGSRKYLDHPLPLDFGLELRPVLGIALGVDVANRSEVAMHNLSENGTYSCPWLIATASSGWGCVADKKEAAAFYGTLKGR